MHLVGFLLILNYDARNHKVKTNEDITINLCKNTSDRN